MSLYNKYRPTAWEDIIGNAETVDALRKLVGHPPTAPHTYLLTGPTGCGKTTIARILSHALESFDTREMNSADFRGIDTVREMIRQTQYRTFKGNRVWIIDESHKLTNDAQNAMLKILEDSPENDYFILCTTEPQKLLKTVRSRCSTYEMTPLTERQITTLLRRVVKDEGEEVDREVYTMISASAEGLPRTALQILEKVLSVPAEQRLNTAQKTTEQESQSIELCRALIKNESWSKISKILKGLKDQDPETVRRHILGYAQSVLLNGENDYAAHVIEEFLEPTYNTGFSGIVYATYSVIRQ